MSANRKNNINTDTTEVSLFVFVRIVRNQNQSVNLVSVKWEMVKLETSHGVKIVDREDCK